MQNINCVPQNSKGVWGSDYWVNTKRECGDVLANVMWFPQWRAATMLDFHCHRHHIMYHKEKQCKYFSLPVRLHHPLLHQALLVQLERHLTWVLRPFQVAQIVAPAAATVALAAAHPHLDRQPFKSRPQQILTGRPQSPVSGIAMLPCSIMNLWLMYIL